MASPSAPPDPPTSPRPEWQTALLTFGPAILAAFALEWVLRAPLGWAPRRALLTSITVGIALALVLQRVVERRGRR